MQVEILSETVPVAGVDGCGPQWIVAISRADRIELAVAENAADVLALTVDCAAVAVDIPMGLAGSCPRRCDSLARGRLGRAGSSVFPAPHRWMVEAYLLDRQLTHAQLLAQKGDRAGISAQGFHLIKKIADWDAVLTRDEQCRVVEAHPEVSFRALARLDGQPEQMSGKKSAEGAVQRMSLVQDKLGFDVTRVQIPTGRPTLALDDILDAVVLTWTARRLAQKRAERLPAEHQRDERGLLMQIVV